MMRLFTRRTAARTAAVSRSSRLTVQQLETRITPALTLHKSAAHPHGTLLAHVDIQSVYMGAGWTNDKDTFDTIRHLEAFTKFIPTSSAGYLGMLTKAKYGVGTGKSEAGFIDSAVNIAGSTISDAQIQSELQSLITAGKLRQPNSNRLYQVFVAPSVKVTTTFGDSQFDFAAYHGAFGGSDAKGKAWPIIAYSVMPYQGTGVNAQNPDVLSGKVLSHIDAITVAASHELAEAVTDTVPGEGWWDSDPNSPFAGFENADCVNAQACVVGGYVVQQCVAPNETMIQPKNAVPYGYPIGGPLASVTTGLVSAFTPESIGFNSWRNKPKGTSWLVADATYNQYLSD